MSLTLPPNTVEGSVRATVSVTGKEFSYDNTFPTTVSLSIDLRIPNPRTLNTLSEVSKAPTALLFPCV